MISRKTKINFYLFTLFFFSMVSTSLAQVTIGSANAPVQGAILQLKKNENVDSNSTQGLGLPRVALRERTQLFPMFDDNTSYIAGSDFKKAQDAKHEGLLVYNISTSPPTGVVWDDLKPGIFIWDGEKWSPVNNSGSGNSLEKPTIGAKINSGCGSDYYGGAVLTVTNLSKYTTGTPNPTFYWTVISGGASYTTSGTYQEVCNLVFSSNETVNIYVTVEKGGAYNTSDVFTLNAKSDQAPSSYYISALSPAKYCYDIKASASPAGCTANYADRTQDIPAGISSYQYQINGTGITSVTWSYSDPEGLVEAFASSSNTCTVTFDYSKLKTSIEGDATGKTFTLLATIVTTSPANSSCQAVYSISREIRIRDCRCCPSTFTDTSGNSYDVGDFGSAGCWTLQNMRNTTYYRGSGIPNGTMTKINTTASETSGFLYSVPDFANNITGELYGYLYTARSANATCNTPDQGFSLPTGDQLQALEKEISANPDKYALHNPYSFSWSGSDYPTSSVYKKYGAGYSMRSWDTAYASNGSSKSYKDGGFDFRTNGGYILNNMAVSPGGALWVQDSFTNGNPSSARLFQYLDTSAVPVIYPNTYGKAYVRCLKK